MDSIDRLAQKIAELYKLNRNPSSTAPRVGLVIEINPLKLQWGESIILSADKLLLPRGFICKIGDRLTIVPDENMKMFYVMNILE